MPGSGSVRESCDFRTVLAVAHFASEKICCRLLRRELLYRV